MASRNDPWNDERDAALRSCIVELKMTFLETAAVLNKQFGKSYTRCAISGRAFRLNLCSPNKAAPRVGVPQVRTEARQMASQARRKPAQAPIQPRVIPMRQFDCDDLGPPNSLNVPLVELPDSHCRWPVSGERAATLFCGRLRLEASSYCPRHHDVSVGRGTAEERRAGFYTPSDRKIA